MDVLRNKKWEETCKAYVLEELTKTDAYLRGFPEARKKKRTTVNTYAYELFKRPTIVARIAELQKQKNKVAEKQFQADAAYVLSRLVQIDQMDVLDILDEAGNIRPISEWPLIWRQFISQFEVEEIFAGRGDDRLNTGLLRKIKWPDKIRNLELLGRHVTVSAFKDNIDLRNPDGTLFPTRIEIVAGDKRKD